MCKKSSTFAAILSRDGGIGRHEGLKILWPVMAVRVQVPLAVQSQKEVLNMKMLSTSFYLVNGREIYWFCNLCKNKITCAVWCR